jgi:hypothetical protein
MLSFELAFLFGMSLAVLAQLLVVALKTYQPQRIRVKN